jgi:outer membrane protein
LKLNIFSIKKALLLLHHIKNEKMKNLIVVLSIALLASCQQEKIGFVDNVKLMDEYQQKIDVEAKFKVQADALTKTRDSISQVFQMEAQAFQAKAQSMPQAKAQEEYAAMQQKGQIIGQQLQQQDQQLQLAGQTEMDSIVSKVKKEIKAYGKKNGYAYILGGGDGGSVLYGTETNDLTDEIVKLLNDNYKK